MLTFELALGAEVSDEVRTESWGRAFLTPSLPLIWDASRAVIETTGLSVDEVLAIGEEALAGAGLAHRTVCPLGEADGRRLAEALEAEPARRPGWEVERTRFMAWAGTALDPPTVSSQKSSDTDQNCGRNAGEAVTSGVREVRLGEIEGLRRMLIGESMPGGIRELEATIDQLLELERRVAVAIDDRWLVAPAAGEPLAACRLMRRGGIAQVEDVATRADARGRGYAKAIVLAAVAAARAAGDSTIFLTADAADWPQLLYAKLGFEAVGDLTVLRRRP